MCFCISQAWILLELMLGVKSVLLIVCLADELLFTEGVSVVYLDFLNIQNCVLIEISYLCWVSLICMSVSV